MFCQRRHVGFFRHGFHMPFEIMVNGPWGIRRAAVRENKAREQAREPLPARYRRPTRSLGTVSHTIRWIACLAEGDLPVTVRWIPQASVTRHTAWSDARSIEANRHRLRVYCIGGGGVFVCAGCVAAFDGCSVPASTVSRVVSLCVWV